VAGNGCALTIINQKKNIMEKIKTQICDLIKFEATTLHGLNKEYHNIQNRLKEGIEKMRESNLFTDEEISSITSFAGSTLLDIHAKYRDGLIDSLRNNFKF
jgi:hypothetical protein